MRATLVAIVIGLIGCVADMGAPPVDPPARQPSDCATSLSLDASLSSSQVMPIGPLALDTVGLNVCLHLDATHNQRASFSTNTSSQPGTASTFVATLQDAARTPVVDGWDVTVGQTDPRTTMVLEWDAPVGGVMDMILWIRASTGRPVTTISLTFIDPLE